MTYVLAVPSIISSTGSIGQLLSMENNSLSGTLLFHGKALNMASAFNPNIVVYSGASLPTSENPTAIANLIQNLKNAYSTPAAADIGSLQNISTLLGTSGTGNLVALGNSIISNQLG